MGPNSRAIKAMLPLFDSNQPKASAPVPESLFVGAVSAAERVDRCGARGEGHRGHADALSVHPAASSPSEVAIHSAFSTCVLF